MIQFASLTSRLDTSLRFHKQIPICALVLWMVNPNSLSTMVSNLVPNSPHLLVVPSVHNTPSLTMQILLINKGGKDNRT